MEFIAMKIQRCIHLLLFFNKINKLLQRDFQSKLLQYMEFIATKIQCCINLLLFLIKKKSIVTRISKLIIAIYGTYCNENLVLHKPIVSEFITMACIDFFVVAITPITTTLIVIATNFFVVLSLFLVVYILPFKNKENTVKLL